MAKISLFDPENSFWSFLTRIYNLAYAGFLWFVTSLPLITIGASTTALYSYAFAVTEQRDGYVARTFFSSFRKNFVKATVLWICMLLVFAFLYFDAYLATTGTNVISKIMFFMILAVIVLFSMLVVHVFPFLSKWDLPYIELCKKILLLGVGTLPISITLLVINAMFVLFVYVFSPALVFAQGFIAALCALFLKSAYLRIPNLNE